MRKLVLGLVCLIVFAMNSAESQTDEIEQIKQNVVAAAADVETYFETTETIFTTKIINDSITNETVSITVTNMLFNQSIPAYAKTVVVEDQKDGIQENASSESYFLDGTLYIRLEDNWSSLTPEEGFTVDDANDLIQNSVIIQNASLVLMGTETLDGVEYYKLNVVPEESVLSLVVGAQLASALIQSPLSLNITDLFNLGVTLAYDEDITNSDTLVWTAWIGKDNSLLKRFAYEFNTTITAEKLDLADEMPNFSLKIDNAFLAEYSNYDQPVKIILPEEAKEAPKVKFE